MHLQKIKARRTTLMKTFVGTTRPQELHLVKPVSMVRDRDPVRTTLYKAFDFFLVKCKIDGYLYFGSRLMAAMLEHFTDNKLIFKLNFHA